MSAASSTPPTIVVMAKPAVPGQVKTRLLDQLSAQQAAQVHAAMLGCVLRRAQAHIPVSGPVDFVVALDGRLSAASPAEPAASWQAPTGWRQIDQGTGDLGQRLVHVWQALGCGPIVFLGVDSPDVPAEALGSIVPAMDQGDAAIGPVDDGGYWTLALRRWEPRIFQGIDWGTASVYHQTSEAAERAGLKLAVLTQWYDIDRPADLRALCRRIEKAQEPALVQLRMELGRVLRGWLTMNMQDPDTHTAGPSTPAPPTEPAAQQEQDQVDLSQSTILIVDDNAQNVELLQAYLEVLPCKTTTASDGVEAIQMIEDPATPKPDLILLDVMMPRMSGFEVCRKLKEDPATRPIPVMMVTALNELGDIERGVESGIDDFLTKPVNKLELITRVKSLLRIRHLKRELDRTMAYIQDVEARPGTEKGMPPLDDPSMTGLDDGPMA